MGNQKIAHVIRSQEWASECADKPLDHGQRIGSGQVLDIHRSGARARPRHHQPVPSQYRKWWVMVRGKRGHGLAVGRGENLFWGSCSGFFGGNVLLG